MESQVFGYFLAIGSGLTMGVGLVALPGLYIAKRILKGKGEKKRAAY